MLFFCFFNTQTVYYNVKFCTLCTLLRFAVTDPNGSSVKRFSLLLQRSPTTLLMEIPNIIIITITQSPQMRSFLPGLTQSWSTHSCIPLARTLYRRNHMGALGIKKGCLHLNKFLVCSFTTNYKIHQLWSRALENCRNCLTPYTLQYRCFRKRYLTTQQFKCYFKVNDAAIQKI